MVVLIYFSYKCQPRKYKQLVFSSLFFPFEMSLGLNPIWQSIVRDNSVTIVYILVSKLQILSGWLILPKSHKRPGNQKMLVSAFRSCDKLHFWSYSCSGFLNLGMDGNMSCIISCSESCTVHCSVLSTIYDHYPLDTNTSPPN